MSNAPTTTTQPQGAIQKGSSNQMNIKRAIEVARPSLAEVCPKHVDLDRLIKVILFAVNKNPTLAGCTPTSIVQCAMGAAELGLDLGGSLGQAYMVPYKNTAQFIIGYRGFIHLARQSGTIASIASHVVYRGDKLSVNFAEEHILHEPDLDAEDMADSDIVAVYAIARFKDGSRQVEVMTRRQVDAIRRRSKASDNGPWKTDYAEMARKTVIRRLCKYLPLSPELAKAIEIDDAATFDVQAEETTPTTDDAPQPSRGKAIADKIKAKHLRVAPEVAPSPTIDEADAPPPDDVSTASDEEIPEEDR